MNHRQQQNTISSCLLTHTKSDLLPQIGEKLTEFPLDQKRWCCHGHEEGSFKEKKPSFGTLYYYHHGKYRTTTHYSPVVIPWSRLQCFIHRVLFFLFRLKTTILSLKCCLFLVIVFTILHKNCVFAEEEQQQYQQEDQNNEILPPDRFYDQAFLPNNWVYDRNVTCGKQLKTIFPSRTWTCANIRVNGRKIAYGHYPYKSGNSRHANKCYETGDRDDMGGICLGLMQNVNETSKLWAASVTNATCGHSTGKRVLLTINSSAQEKPRYAWVDLDAGYGWVESLHCLTLPAS